MTNHLDQMNTCTEHYDIAVFNKDGVQVAHASRPKSSKEHVLEEIANRNRMNSNVINGYTAHLVKCITTRSYELAE